MNTQWGFQVYHDHMLFLRTFQLNQCTSPPEDTQHLLYQHKTVIYQFQDCYTQGSFPGKDYVKTPPNCIQNLLFYEQTKDRPDFILCLQTRCHGHEPGATRSGRPGQGGIIFTVPLLKRVFVRGQGGRQDDTSTKPKTRQRRNHHLDQVSVIVSEVD